MDDEALRAQFAATRASLRLSLSLIEDILAEQRAVADVWEPVRHPVTGQRLCDVNRRRGLLRFVTRWHGERSECELPIPSVA